MADQPLTAKELVMQFREILATWPLYRSFAYVTTSDFTEPPEQLQLYCTKCENDQIWQCEVRTAWGIGFNGATYTCRNCGKSETRYYWYWLRKQGGESLFFKVGQYPPLEERIEPELEKRLTGEDLQFYRNALRCRNFNLGLAALSYLRRVVENRMNDLLDLIAELAEQEETTSGLIEGIAAAKKSRVFDDKVTFAAKILPSVLRPGGTNPVDLLHDLASEGIHRKSEAECIDIFDQSRFVFEYLFRELQVRKAEAGKFMDGLKVLAARRAARKPAE